MQATFKKTKLLEMLKLLKGFFPKKSYLPILMNVKITFNGDNCEMTATDMEKAIQISHTTDDNLKITLKGSTTVKYSLLMSVVKQLGDSIKIGTENIGGNDCLVLGDGIKRFELFTISATEYVAIDMKPLDHMYNIPKEKLLRGIDNISYIVNNKSFSPILTGLLIRQTEQQLTIAGSNSFMLGEYKQKRSSPGKYDVIIPVVEAKLLADLLRKSLDGKATTKNFLLDFHFSENSYIFKFTVGKVVVRMRGLRIIGNYPDYDREEIMPVNFNTIIETNGANLAKGIESVNILTRYINDFVELKVEDSIVISSGRTDKGVATANVVGKSNNPITFAVCGTYLRKFISHGNKSDIKISLVDVNKPVMVQGMDPNMRFVVRPLLNN